MRDRDGRRTQDPSRVLPAVKSFEDIAPADQKKVGVRMPAPEIPEGVGHVARLVLPGLDERESDEAEGPDRRAQGREPPAERSESTVLERVPVSRYHVDTLESEVLLRRAEYREVSPMNRIKRPAEHTYSGLAASPRPRGACATQRFWKAEAPPPRPDREPARLVLDSAPAALRGEAQAPRRRGNTTHSRICPFPLTMYW